MKVEETTYFRKIDTAGRIIIPSKLRTTYNISEGTELQYHIICDDDNTYYLAVKVKEPAQEAEADEVQKLIKEYGLDTINSLIQKIDMLRK